MAAPTRALSRERPRKCRFPPTPLGGERSQTQEHWNRARGRGSGFGVTGSLHAELWWVLLSAGLRADTATCGHWQLAKL